jgi:hypothetical protein
VGGCGRGCVYATNYRLHALPAYDSFSRALFQLQCLGRDLSAGSYASNYVLFLFRAALAEVKLYSCF